MFTAGRDAIGWVRHTAVDHEGRRLGDVVGLLVDRQVGTPQWLLLHMRHGHHVVPLGGIVSGAGRVHVPVAEDVVRRSPAVPADGSLTARLEGDLCRLYGLAPTRGALLSRWERRRTTALARLDADGNLAWEPPPRHDHEHGERRDGPVPPPVGRHERPDRPMAPIVVDATAPGGPLGRALPRRPPDATVVVGDADPARGVRLAAALNRRMGLRVVACLDDGSVVLSTALRDPPDVCVLRRGLTGVDEDTIAHHVRRVAPHTQVLLLPAVDGEDLVGVVAQVEALAAAGHGPGAVV